MTGHTNLPADQVLEDHLDSINRYIDESNCKFATFQQEFLLIADMDSDELFKKTRDELFNCAYLLYAYSSYLQDEVNKNKIVLNWCNGQLDYLLAKHRDDYGFTKYTKHEAKIPIMCLENSYAGKVMDAKLAAESRLQALDGKVYEIKRLGDVLLEKGKRS